MITIDIKKLTGGPDSKMYTADVPALPPVGAYLDHDRDGFGGTVQGVSYWWDESGKLTIEVVIK